MICPIMSRPTIEKILEKEKDTVLLATKLFEVDCLKEKCMGYRFIGIEHAGGKWDCKLIDKD